jgi:hypothetical protein
MIAVFERAKTVHASDRAAPVIGESIGLIIGIVLKNQVRLKLNRTYELLVYAAVVNLLGDNMDTSEKNS